MGTLNISRMLRHLSKAISLREPWAVHGPWLLTSKEFPFLKGLMFERTGRRNSLYFWRFIVPAFHPDSTMLLNFSERLNNGYTIDGSEDEIVGKATACVLETPGLLENLQTTEAPSDFLERYPVPIEYPENASAKTVFDLAASAALAGRREIAVRLIIDLRGRTSFVPNETITRYAETLLAIIEQGGDVTPLLNTISDDHKKF